MSDWGANDPVIKSAAPPPASGGWGDSDPVVKTAAPAPTTQAPLPKGKGTLEDPYDLSGLAPPEEHATRARLPKLSYYATGDELRLNEHGGEGGNPVLGKKGKGGWYAQDPSDPKSFPRLAHDSGGAYIMVGGQRKGIGPQKDRGIGGYVGDEFNTAARVPAEALAQSYVKEAHEGDEWKAHPEKKPGFAQYLAGKAAGSVPDVLGKGGNLAALATSPLTGLLHGAVTRPLASAMTAALPHEQSQSSIADLFRNVTSRTPYPAHHTLSNEEQQAANEGRINTGMSLVAPAKAGAPGVSATLGKVLSPIGEAFSETASRVKMGMGHEPGAPPTPAMRAKAEPIALKYLGNLAKKADPTGVKLGANPAEQMGKPVTAAEALGREAKTQLKVAGRRGGQTPENLESQLRQRQNEAPARVVSDFHEITGIDPEHVEGNFTKLAEDLRTRAGPLYEASEAKGPMTSPELEKLMERPSMKKAMQIAHDIADEEGVSAEEKTKVLGDRPIFHPDGSQMTTGGRMENGLVVGGKPLMVKDWIETVKPTARTWDMLKRGLDAALDEHRDSLTGKLNSSNPKVRATIKTVHALRDALVDANPAYGAALDAGGEPLRLEEAFGDAPKLMSNMKKSAFDTKWSKYSDSQKEAFKAGIVNDIRAKMMGGKMKLTDLLTPEYKEKLATVFGKDAAEKLSARLEAEKDLQTDGYRMKPGVGSDTSESLLGAGEQDEAIKAGARAVQHVVTGHWGRALMHVLSAPVVGAYRGAQMPLGEATRDIAGALLRGSPSALAKALQAQGATPVQSRTAVGELMRAGVFATGATAGAGHEKPANDPSAAGPVPPKGADPYRIVKMATPEGYEIAVPAFDMPKQESLGWKYAGEDREHPH